MEIKAITIDFWNTIYDSSNGEERHLYRLNELTDLLNELGIEKKEAELIEGIKESWRYFEYHWKNNQRTPEALETVSHMFSYLELPADKNSLTRIAKVFEDSVIIHSPQLLPDVKESLKLLKEKYKLCLISDTGFSPGTILKKLLEIDDIIDYFDSFSFSNETGVSKPHPKAYSTVLEHINVQPESALHIGDIEKTDIVGAKNYGMKAIRFVGDKNNKINHDNPKETLADFEADSWNEIIKILL